MLLFQMYKWLNVDFALFKLMKHINLDINGTAWLCVVHIMQHPTFHPTTTSTDNTMVNNLKKNLS